MAASLARPLDQWTTRSILWQSCWFLQIFVFFTFTFVFFLFVAIKPIFVASLLQPKMWPLHHQVSGAIFKVCKKRQRENFQQLACSKYQIWNHGIQLKSLKVTAQGNHIFFLLSHKICSYTQSQVFLTGPWLIHWRWIITDNPRRIVKSICQKVTRP